MALQVLQSPHGELGGVAARGEPQVGFQAIVAPDVSLSRMQVALLVTATTTASLAVSVATALYEARFLVALGSTVALLLAAAIAGSRRHGLRRERIVIVRSTVIVERYGARGLEDRTRWPTTGLGIETHMDACHGCRSLVLAHRHRRLEIGHHLSASERSAFFTAFAEALRSAGNQPPSIRILAPAETGRR